MQEVIIHLTNGSRESYEIKRKKLGDFIAKITTKSKFKKIAFIEVLNTKYTASFGPIVDDTKKEMKEDGVQKG